MIASLLLSLFLSLPMSCGTMNSARPLDQGEHVVGATFGGAIVDAGFTTIPLPNLMVEGRSGLSPLLERPLDVSYGLNLTGLPFGLVGLHGGVGWLLMDQDGGRPALSLSNRLYLYSNHLDARKTGRALWAADQLEVLASWDTNPALIYAGGAQYFDVTSPRLLLSPVVGVEFHLGERWGLQLEGRHLAINQNKEPLNTLEWVTWGPGALAATLGVSRSLGESP